ncbi:MAG: sugar ABC transporter permease [Deltaproteobacteria bacterium]|nr:sugar ABC transporter permease [Deltaproteobacteria bacterium]
MRKQQGLVLILPAILVMGLFTAYPLFEGLRIAFTNTHLLKEGARYIGFQNFLRLLSDEIFWISLYHSVLLTSVVVFLQFVLGLILALAMNQKLPGMSLFKSVIMASWVIPVAATVILFKFMAQPDIGLINIVIRSLGFEDLNRYWLGDPAVALPFIMLLHLWRNVPFYGVAFLAAMQAIPKSFYEAAEIDGANEWHKFWYITLPGIRKMVMVMVTIHVLWTFNNFDFVYLATGGGPVNATDVLPVYVYRQCWTSYTVGYGASIGTVMLLLLMLYFIVFIKISEKDNSS